MWEEQSETSEYGDGRVAGAGNAYRSFDRGAFVKAIRRADDQPSVPQRVLARIDVVNDFLPLDVRVADWTCIDAYRTTERNLRADDLCIVSLRHDSGEQIDGPGEQFSQSLAGAIKSAREDFTPGGMRK